MWTCKQCQADIEDDEIFCYACGAPKSENEGSWVCTKCNAEVNKGDSFCSNCGQSKEQKKEHASQQIANSTGKGEVATPASSMPAPATSSIQIAETVKQPNYDASVFASQFPQWDLLPPSILVRRIKRSI